jgi:1-acyl-sn-glycerol-3-phosphate acyltransferase
MPNIVGFLYIHEDMGVLIFNIFYYLIILVAVTVYLIATLVVFPFTVPFDPSRRAVHEISRGISMIFFRTAPMWHTRVEGLENVDKNKVYVIVLNHRSMVDIPMLYWLPLNFRWISKSSARKIPFIGPYMWLHGDILIPLDKPRKAAAMAMTDGVMWLKDRKVCVSVFPEGTRSKTGEIGRFKPTAFALAREAGVAILPVVLDGSDVAGKNGRLPWRHTFTVRVLPAVSAEKVATRDPREIMEETRERMISAKQLIINRMNKNS